MQWSGESTLSFQPTRKRYADPVEKITNSPTFLVPYPLVTQATLSVRSVAEDPVG